jgi:tetratricopeptide (TPR) repeat protein
MHEAAYNLGVLLADDRRGESIERCLTAFELSPNSKYGYTLGFYLMQNGDAQRAAETLKLVTEQWPVYVDAHLLLGDIYGKEGRRGDAEALYIKALENQGLSKRDRYRLEAKITALPPPEKMMEEGGE